MDEKQERQERSVLEWILEQYTRAKRRKAQLEERLTTLRSEYGSTKSPSYDGMPHGSGQSEGAAGILLKISDVEEQIREQKKREESAICQVMEIIELLPEQSEEREICELRYLDGKQWGRISREVNFSISQCHRLHRAAITDLLNFAYVQEIVKKNSGSYDYCIASTERGKIYG